MSRPHAEAHLSLLIHTASLASFAPSGLEDLVQLAFHCPPSDPALHGAAESRHLVGECMARVDHHGTVLDG